jgi:hypothetical protein
MGSSAEYFTKYKKIHAYLAVAIRKKAHKSVWACLPAGPLERHKLGGGPGGMIGEGVLFTKDLQKGEKHLPWKGHNSGKPLLVTGLDATPQTMVA